MAEQKLLVKREGDFHYPIYFPLVLMIVLLVEQEESMV